MAEQLSLCHAELDSASYFDIILYILLFYNHVIILYLYTHQYLSFGTVCLSHE